jgi:hypothetical protein
MAAKGKATAKSGTSAYRFESARVDSLFTVLDAIAWMDSPSAGQIAQFADVDPRTAGKLLKNAVQIGLVDQIAGRGYTLMLPYPYKGSPEQKQAVVREALVRLPLLTSVRQFMGLGDPINVALRKAATVAGHTPFDSVALAPLLEWAKSLGALTPGLVAEDLVDAAEKTKVERHLKDSKKKVAFLSHSSKDKAFIRQLAADLTAHGVSVWLDEQRIRVGDSIPEQVAQGLADSDYFVVAISGNSVQSEWVKKELNNALVHEVERRQVHVLPIRLDDAPIPESIRDKKYADFSRSYKSGLEQVLDAMKEGQNGSR